MSEDQPILERLGIRAATLDRIRLTPGVVGKASYVAGIAIIALGAAAWGLQEPVYRLIAAALIVALFALYFFGVLWFGTKNPGVALLEGADLLRWRQLETTASNPPTDINREIIEPAPAVEDQSPTDGA